MKRLLAAFVIALTSSAANAAPSGNELYEWLVSTEEADRNLGQLYVLGASDAFRMAQVINLGSAAAGFCMPKGVVGRQIVEATQDELRRQVASRHGPAAVFVYAALTRTWPCKTKTE